MGRNQQSVKQPEGDRELSQDPARVRRRRTAAGLSVRELAARAHVSTGTISHLENGIYSAEVKTLAAVARALGCEIEELLPPERSRGAA